MKTISKNGIYPLLPDSIYKFLLKSWHRSILKHALKSHIPKQSGDFNKLIGIKHTPFNGAVILTPYYINQGKIIYFTDNSCTIHGDNRQIISFLIRASGLRSLNSEVNKYEMILQDWLEKMSKHLKLNAKFIEPKEDHKKAPEKDQKESRELMNRAYTIILNKNNKIPEKTHKKLRDAIISRDYRALKNILQ